MDSAILLSAIARALAINSLSPSCGAKTANAAPRNRPFAPVQRDLTFASAMRRIKTVRYVTVCVKRPCGGMHLSAFASACTGAVQTTISAARQSGDRKTVLVMAQNSCSRAKR
jgi:hypothetical protein